MKSSTIKYIVISDIHLGHRNNKTEDIIKNLKVFFNNYAPRRDSLDYIFIAGDLFDSLLDLSTDDIYQAILWLSVFLGYCKSNKIKLRILEGTSSHDWEQSKLGELIKNIGQYDVDFKYIDSLHIERDDALGIDILYVPDEWDNDTSVTFRQVKEMLACNGIDSVDIAIMHGQFTYQLPSAAIKAPKHNEADYMSIVRYLINIGHVHQYSTYERIIAQGSFDRLTHGDEEPKGGTYNIINKDGSYEYLFIENKGAKTFITINVKEMPIDKCVDYIRKKTKDLRPGSYVRIRAKKDSSVFKNFDIIKKEFTDIHLSKVSDDKDEVSKVTATISTDLLGYDPVIIRPDNILESVMDIIETKYKLDTDSISLAKKQLTESM